jgi:putative ABC transport system permease protein
MFLALRDLRFAKGRFALLGGVIALMTFMVVMLSGLTAGLGNASISAIDKLPVDSIAFQQPPDGQDVSFTTSSLRADTAQRLATQPGVRAAYPLGISTSQLHAASATEAVTLMGTESALFPARKSGKPPAVGQLAVTSQLAADAGLRLGDAVSVAGQQLTVAAVVADASFNHLPVAYTSIDTWRQLSRADGLTAVGLQLDGASAGELGTAANVHVVSKSAAFGAVGAYTSEQGSLNLMRGLLVAVSVLVVGSFFTVWTMQRASDLAVVRAIGGSRGQLARDAIGQALLVLIGGAAVGAALAAAAGVLARHIVPFLLTPATVALPLAAMVGIGLLGAALPVRKITTVSPLAALGAAR